MHDAFSHPSSLIFLVFDVMYVSSVHPRSFRRRFAFHTVRSLHSKRRVVVVVFLGSRVEKGC